MRHLVPELLTPLTPLTPPTPLSKPTHHPSSFPYPPALSRLQSTSSLWVSRATCCATRHGSNTAALGPDDLSGHSSASTQPTSRLLIVVHDNCASVVLWF